MNKDNIVTQRTETMNKIASFQHFSKPQPQMSNVFLHPPKKTFFFSKKSFIVAFTLESSSTKHYYNTSRSILNDLLFRDTKHACLFSQQSKNSQLCTAE